MISFCLDTLVINQGDVQLELIPVDTQLYKSRPLYLKQLKISKYMRHGRTSDWSGKYFASKKEVAESYGSDYLTDGKGGYYSKTYKVKKPFFILNIKKRAFADGNIPQKDKANALKKFFRERGLGLIQHQNLYNEGDICWRQAFHDISRELKRFLNNNGPSLAAVLHNVGVALLCPHDQQNNELIFPALYQEGRVVNEIHSEVVVLNSRDGGETGRFANLDEVNGAYKGIIEEQKRKIKCESRDSSFIIVD